MIGNGMMISNLMSLLKLTMKNKKTLLV
ncbi:hypothetical protein RJ641_011366 [Dillenia turbinata]|uniref:Uncharacterized protein n=1 Tax=Dillenia turbinata TaxID=194707 RepID=A0AAN8V5F3_9MAGN